MGFAVISRLFRKAGNTILRPKTSHSHHIYTSTIRQETAYLDGLKGLAGIVIILCNIGQAVGHEWTRGSGFGLPLSYVATGYVLSLKPLQHIQKEEWTELLATVTSRTFRRVLRIYLPAVVATFIAACCTRFSLFDYTNGFQRPTIRTTRSWSEQLYHLYREDSNFLHISRWKQVWPTYIRALWTLQTMMRGPLVLFLTTVGLSRARRDIRCLAIAALMLSSYHANQLEIMSMMGGLIVADLHIANREQVDGLKLKNIKQLAPWESGIIFISRVSLVTSAIILSLPVCSRRTFSLCSVMPKGRTDLGQSVAAMLLVWSIGQSAKMRTLVTWQLLQLSSDLSYSAYLVHGPVLETIGYRIASRLLKSSITPVPANHTPIPTHHPLRIILCFFAISLAILCAATLFWKFVDMPVVRFMKILECKCSVPPLTTPILPLEGQQAEKTSPKTTILSEIDYPSKMRSTGVAPPYTPNRKQRMSIVFRFIWFLAPSPLQDCFWPNKDEKAHPTAWLDGLRGFAAIFVFWYHLMNPFHPNHLVGYGFDPKNSHFIQLPLLRLIYSGNEMVYMFFVISGYVLSTRGISQICSRTSHTTLVASLSSSIFRRATRLALPPIASTFLNMVLVHLGVFNHTRSIASNASILPGYREGHLVQRGSFSRQLWDWAHHVERMTTLYARDAISSRYDPHTWTINVEFHCSMLVFLYLLCFAKTKTWIRVSFCILLSIYLWRTDAWHENMFLMGILIAEINQFQGLYTNSNLKIGEGSRWKNAAHWSFFLLSLFIASCPEHKPWQTPGYRTLARFVELRRFWGRFGAPLIVLSISNSKSVQTLFTNRLAQFLANISFSLYLMHYLTIHTIGYAVIPRLMEKFGKDTLWGYEGGFVLGSVVVTIVTLWLSDLFWRVVDAPSVRFSRWVENLCLIDSQKKDKPRK